MRKEFIVFDLFGHRAMADAIAAGAGITRGRVIVRRFPDEECYVKIEMDITGADVAFVANLARPDSNVPALLFAADTARELGARRIGLVAPYLPYMRQDDRFHDGEAVTSRLFARVLSQHFDWLMTVDPHLHRNPDLTALYAIPSIKLTAAPVIAEWIRTHVARPYVLGPDDESAQWVSAIATLLDAPWAACHKTRQGDRDVTITLPQGPAWHDRNIVIVDDIVASGYTMKQAIAQVRSAVRKSVACIAIHALFSESSHDALKDVGAMSVVSTDSIPHASNAITIVPLLRDAIRRAVEDVSVSRPSVSRDDKA